MREYLYYDAYHRKRRMPFFFLREVFRGKKGAFFLCFLISLTLGLVLFSEQIQAVGAWLCSCMEEMDARTLAQKELFCYLLIRRGLLLVLLLLFGMTRIRRPLYTLTYLLCGLLAGSVCAAFLRAYGWKGAIVFLFSFFPHGIVYVVLFCYLFWLFCERQEESCAKNGTLKRGIAVFLYSAGLALLFLSGLYLEGAVNPLLLDWIRDFL